MNFKKINLLAILYANVCLEFCTFLLNQLILSVYDDLFHAMHIQDKLVGLAALLN